MAHTKRYKGEPLKPSAETVCVVLVVLFVTFVFLNYVVFTDSDAGRQMMRHYSCSGGV